MNLNYFGYYLHDRNSQKDYRVDLSAMMKHFASYKTLNFRRTLQYNSDFVYPLPFSGSLYYFIQSRDGEIIKSVEKASLKHQDMAAVIGATRSVGFTSYVYFQDCWFAIGTKVLSPRVSAFAHVMNEFLQHIGSHLEFRVKVFTDQVKPQDVVKLDHVGAVTLDMSASTGVFANVMNTIAGDGFPNILDIGELEIRIKPVKRKSNLKPLLQKIINTVPATQISALDARARVDAGDRMKDVFIFGAGGVRDQIQTKNETAIPAAIQGSAKRNVTLQDKIKEFKHDANYHSSDTNSLNITW